jgi:hypothetical protein
MLVESDVRQQAARAGAEQRGATADTHFVKREESGVGTYFIYRHLCISVRFVRGAQADRGDEPVAMIG